MARQSIILVLMCMGFLTASAQAYSGGAGTPEDPYQIATAQDLIALGATPTDYDKHFILTADIDLATHTFTRALIAFDTDEFAPFPDSTADHSEWYFQGTVFAGSLAGNRHVIRNLNIKGEEFLGLFGSLGRTAVIRDLALRGGSIEGTGNYVGGLAGRNEGLLLNCSNGSSVVGQDYVGGLVGLCVRMGSVLNCCNSGAVEGRMYVGGLVGQNDSGCIVNCYSTGVVSGYNLVGGLVGSNSGAMVNSYAAAEIISGGSGVRDRFGSLVGESRGQIENCFWNEQLYRYGGYGTPLDGGRGTAEMQDVDLYLDAGWDFVDEHANGTAETWQMPLGGGYPTLRIEDGFEPPMPLGRGTATEPFLITNASELGCMGYHPSAHYRLDADIDLSGIIWSQAVVPWFGGQLDGNAHTIAHLRIEGGGLLGLFGHLAANSVVMGLRLETASVRGTGCVVGTLAGRSQGTVTDCRSSGEVAGKHETGGLIGANEGDIVDCRTGVTVTSDGTWVGGLVGNNYDDGRLLSCGGDVHVSGQWRVGGLAGENAGSIWDCNSIGPVLGEGRYVGGLVGYNSGAVSKCCSMEDVTGEESVGGLVGHNEYGNVSNSYSTSDVTGTGQGHIGGLVGRNSRGCISGCYSTGNVTGTETVGGLIGYTNGNVWNCYSTGAVVGNKYVGGLIGFCSSIASRCYSTGRVTGDRLVGGLIGYGGAEFDCFWDVETSGVAVSSRGVGLTTAEMQNLSTYLEAGWDFWGQSDSGLAETWRMPEQGGYPRLSVFEGYEPAMPAGHGTEADPYLLTTSEDLAFMGFRPLAQYRLERDIDVSGQIWNGPIIPSFGGYLDGNGHAVCHLQVEGGGFLGLFGHLAARSVVVNLGFEDCSVQGRGHVIGVLTARNDGFVTDCYCTSQTSGYEDTGGLIGYNAGSVLHCHSAGTVTGNAGGLIGNNAGAVSGCFSTATISGSNASGGLIGTNSGIVSDSHSTGELEGRYSFVGGLVGYNLGSLSDCYSTGSVTGGGDLGGLVGWNSKGTISRCYSRSTVTGSDRVGGLIGTNDVGSITACHAAGMVCGNDRVGGLIGQNGEAWVSASYSVAEVAANQYVGGLIGYNVFSTVSYCYSIGHVTGNEDVGGLAGFSSTGVRRRSRDEIATKRCVGDPVGYAGGSVDSNFWNVETSGLNVSALGIGLTTIEMQNINTFLAAGWDFVDEVENGTEDI